MGSLGNEGSLSPLAQELKIKALCESDSQAVAVSALIGAAADLLCLRFDPQTAAGLIVEVTVEALAEQFRRAPLLAVEPAGRA